MEPHREDLARRTPIFNNLQLETNLAQALHLRSLDAAGRRDG
jgi:hypothetical protein